MLPIQRGNSDYNTGDVLVFNSPLPAALGLLFMGHNCGVARREEGFPKESIDHQTGIDHHNFVSH